GAFAVAWEFPCVPAGRAVPWALDMGRIFGALNVVDNWDAATWQTVSASNGTQGAGGGTPRVSWAPEFGPDTVPPVTTASLSGAAHGGWYASSVSVSLHATDD